VSNLGKQRGHGLHRFFRKCVIVKLHFCLVYHFNNDSIKFLKEFFFIYSIHHFNMTIYSHIIGDHYISFKQLIGVLSINDTIFSTHV